jgi:TPP-dependent pyruvate/acetoin dehydrogenase alpha subunit
MGWSGPLQGARNKLVDLEDLSDEELKKFEQEFQRLHRQSQEPTHKSQRPNRDAELPL